MFEGEDRAGGRAVGDVVDGFHLDGGADFFCDSYDETFRLCRELDLSLVRSSMRLGWYRRGRWTVTNPFESVGSLFRNIAPSRVLGLLSPRSQLPILRLLGDIRRQSEQLNFSSTSRIAELDDTETFGEYLDRIGMPHTVRMTFKGFLEMTMGHVEDAGAAYMLTYLAEMLVKSGRIHVPEKGAGAFTRALAAACGDAIRTSTPVQRVVVSEGKVRGVVVDGGHVEADAVICAVPANKVARIIPQLSPEVRRTLGSVPYSSGVRVVLGLKRAPLPPGWHGALYPEDETPLLLDRSINLPGVAPPGRSTLDMLVGRETAKELIPLDDEEITSRMLAAVHANPPPRSCLPRDDRLFTKVYRWPEAVCMMSPGTFKAMRRVAEEVRREVEGLGLAGDYMRVPCVNGAVVSGVAAAKEILDRRNTSSTPRD